MRASAAVFAESSLFKIVARKDPNVEPMMLRLAPVPSVPSQMIRGTRDATAALATLERTFTLVCHDAVTTAIGPALVRNAQQLAPGVVFRFLAEAAADTNDLRYGSTDLEVGSAQPISAEIRFEAVGHDHLVLAVRKGHVLTRGKLTPARYAKARHITISRRGRLHDPIDDALSSLGLRRLVVAAAPTTTAALQFIRNSDLCVAVASGLTGDSLSELGLTAIRIPFDLPRTQINSLWHRRNDNDPAHIWLRDQTRKAIVRSLK